MTSPWRDMYEAAEHLRLRDGEGRWSARAAREWVDRHHVPTKKRGHAVLVRVDDLDAALTERRVR